MGPKIGVPYIWCSGEYYRKCSRFWNATGDVSNIRRHSVTSRVIGEIIVSSIALVVLFCLTCRIHRLLSGSRAVVSALQRHGARHTPRGGHCIKMQCEGLVRHVYDTSFYRGAPYSMKPEKQAAPYSTKVILTKTGGAPHSLEVPTSPDFTVVVSLCGQYA